MITNDLYNEILLRPRENGANTLYAVSGYASATFANRHLREFEDLTLSLIIGMPGATRDHLGYLRIKSLFRNRFVGYYLLDSPFVHSKMYGWFNNEISLFGYAGSANYSQPGFIGENQLNQMSLEDPNLILEYYNELLPRCVRIEDYEPEEVVPEELIHPTVDLAQSVAPGTIEWEVMDKRVRISLLARNGTLPQRSGLNWGQRPELGREPNQAYLSIRRDSRKTGFLPTLAETFTLITDDNYSIDCAVAQQGRKAIHSTLDNSEIGKYFRNRLGVELGAPVLKQHLIEYGRTDFTIEKINEETFLLDFSVVDK